MRNRLPRFSALPLAPEDNLLDTDIRPGHLPNLAVPYRVRLALYHSLDESITMIYIIERVEGTWWVPYVDWTPEMLSELSWFLGEYFRQGYHDAR